MRTTDILGVVALMGLILVGCGCAGDVTAQNDEASVDPPDWFENPNRAYSEDRYLVAVAKGPSAQAAQDRAFGNLARIFEADIQASRSLLDRYEEVTEDGEISGSEGTTLTIVASDITSDEKLLNTKV
ncbi:MAG: hypothetical protein ABEL51_12810, partial [Salinibacter sp.]